MEVNTILIQFNFQNYKSFRDETILDLSSTKITEFSDRVVCIGKEKILPVAAIYGANASGKSNVYSAFRFMTGYVIQSFKYGDEEEKFKKFRPMPFYFDNNSENQNSSFEVYFTVPFDKTEKIYNYGFCIGKEGITEEWLNIKEKNKDKFSTIFYRTEDSLEMTGIPKNSRTNIEIALEKQVLIISLGSKLKVAKCKIIRDWFSQNQFANFGDEFNNLFMSQLLPGDFIEDKNVQKSVIKYFASFDESIQGFNIEKTSIDENSEETGYKISSLHKKIDSEEMAGLPFEMESAGTLKMFYLYPQLREALSKGSLFFVDELNARLHPLLLRNLMLTFLNPKVNVNHAQLIFTTHDTWQLSNQILRRDEIWFTEKCSKGISTLYSLADFIEEDGTKIIKDGNYEKNYLIGKYGAIPTLKNIDLFKEE